MSVPGSGGFTPSPLRFAGIGAELVGPILVAVYIGYRLDAWLGTGPWLLVAFAVLGIVTGFVQFFRSVLPPRDRGDGSGGAGAGSA